MLKSQINRSHSLHNLISTRKPFVSGDTTNHSSSSAYSPAIFRQHASTKKSNTTHARSTSNVGSIKAISNLFTKGTAVKCVIRVQPTISSALTGVVGGVVDGVSDLLGRSFLLELVSNDLDSKGKQKTVKEYARYEALDFDINVYTYKCNFDVPKDFGEIGAVLVENEYSKKMFFKTIVLDNGVTFTCDSWVHSKFDNSEKRIFFTNKVDPNPS